MNIILTMLNTFIRDIITINISSEFVGPFYKKNNDNNKNWRNRRSQKLDKMELLNLQSSLQSEIQAKAAISEELSKTRADLIATQK